MAHHVAASPCGLPRFALQIAALLAPRKDAIAFPQARAGREYTPAKCERLKATLLFTPFPQKCFAFSGAPFWQALVASLGGKMRLKLFEPTEAILYAEGRRKDSFNASFDAAPFPQNASVLGALICRKLHIARSAQRCDCFSARRPSRAFLARKVER